MIYFIDEDFRKLRALASELQTFYGYETKIIRDADSAFKELRRLKASDVDLVIIDVMLAVKTENEVSHYTREETDDFHQTGLVLLNELASANPDVFPSKAIYFTHAANIDLVREVNASASKHQIKILKKQDYDTAYDFGIDIKKIIDENKNIEGG